MRRLRRRQPVTPAQVGGAEDEVAGPRPGDRSRGMVGLEPVQSFTGMKEELYAIAWSADGMTLAATSDSGPVGLWTSAAGELRLLTGHFATPIGLAWHPALPLLATGADDKTVRLWQTETGQSSVLCELKHPIKGVAWSPAGSRLAVYDFDGGLSIYDTEDRTVLRSAHPYKTGGFGLCWSPDGRILVAGNQSGDVIVCSSEDLRLIHRLNGGRGGPFRPGAGTTR